MQFKIQEGVLLDIIKGAQSTARIEGVIKVKEDRWIMKCQSEGDVLMFAVMVPEEAMEDWDPEGPDEIGFQFGDLEKFLGSSDSMVKIETYTTDVGVHKIRAIKGNTVLEVPMTDLEFVAGKDVTVPNIDWVLEASGNLEFIKGFVSKSDTVVNADAFMIGCRDEMICLYTEHDDTRTWDALEWDFFEDYTLDWSNGMYNEKESHNPPEDHATDVILSTSWAKGVHFLSDEGTLYLNNHAPAKMVFDMDSEIKASYFFSPRIPDNDSRYTIPDDVIEERGIES